MTDEWGIHRLDLAAYLARIGCTATDDLARLHRAHVAAIPFENLDVVLGRGIDPDLEAVQDKLVRRRRGGYCYEHATLFGAALERLGYPVLRLLSRVGGDGTVPTPRTHMVLAVEAAGERWFADVGFGSGVLTPIPWRSDAVEHQGDWLVGLQLGADGETWELWERTPEGGRAVLHRVTEEPQHAADVRMANHFTATYPSSPFVRQVVAIRKDEHTRWTLAGRELTTARPDGTEEKRTLSGEEVAAALEEDFRITLTAADRAAVASL
ncbi:arylamine N-acetyltransferase family protein [Pseudonocardia pini]|uniref:arylamine N-acetyltransferase family protein n=1 Tax=Pseudonocardia pini TaxID=2758030 RepID=UPI0015EFF6B3|nr:arylamine N-acetyltransferase [Pseudonocardia pini]